MEENEYISPFFPKATVGLVGLEYFGESLLKKDCSNFPEWAAAVNKYAEDNNLKEILNWTSRYERRPSSGEHKYVSATFDNTDTMRSALRHNNARMDFFDECYMQGAAEAWTEALGLCAERDSNPVEFVEKFKSAMVKLNRFKQMRLNEKQQVLQFMTATKSIFPDQHAHEYIALITPEKMTLNLACKEYLKFTAAMTKLDDFKDSTLNGWQRYRLFVLAMDSANYEAQMVSKTSD
jgi:hypothetical protein